MKSIFVIAATALLGLIAQAMPTTAQLEKARPIIQELMAEDFAAFKSGKKNAEDVGDAAMKLVANAETEAAKFLLCKAAFGLYIRGKSYDKAADVMDTFGKSIPDIPPVDLVELVQKSAKGVRGKDAPRLFATYRALQIKATAQKERDKVRAALAESPADASLRRAYAEWCVFSGDWKAALASFGKLDGAISKAAKSEASDPVAAADFWWTYEPSVRSAVVKDSTVAFKQHAVVLYKYCQSEGTLTGLRKTLVEKRIAQFETETAVPLVVEKGEVEKRGSPVDVGVQKIECVYCAGGGVYLDTGIIPKHAMSIEWDVKFPTKYTGNKNFSGANTVGKGLALNTDTSLATALEFYDTAWRNRKNGLEIERGKRTKIKWDSRGIHVNGKLKVKTPINDCTMSLVLFDRNRSGKAANLSAECWLYGLKISDHGKVLLDYVPATQKNEVGFYDKISQKFTKPSVGQLQGDVN